MTCVTKSNRNREIRSITKNTNKMLLYIRPQSKFWCKIRWTLQIQMKK